MCHIAIYLNDIIEYHAAGNPAETLNFFHLRAGRGRTSSGVDSVPRLVFAPRMLCSHAWFRGAGQDASLLSMSLSGTVRRRQGSGGAAKKEETGVVAKVLSLCVAVVVKFLVLLREIYGQFFVLTMDTLIQKPFLFLLNTVHIENHKHLTDLIGKRGRKTPLITVSNHCSSLDEPLLFSALIPWPILQWQLRWSLCNDDMFFRSSLNPSPLIHLTPAPHSATYP